MESSEAVQGIEAAIRALSNKDGAQSIVSSLKAALVATKLHSAPGVYWQVNPVYVANVDGFYCMVQKSPEMQLFYWKTMQVKYLSNGNDKVKAVLTGCETTLDSAKEASVDAASRLRSKHATWVNASDHYDETDSTPQPCVNCGKLVEASFANALPGTSVIIRRADGKMVRYFCNLVCSDECVATNSISRTGYVVGENQ